MSHLEIFHIVKLEYSVSYPNVTEILPLRSNFDLHNYNDVYTRVGEGSLA